MKKNAGFKLAISLCFAIALPLSGATFIGLLGSHVETDIARREYRDCKKDLVLNGFTKPKALKACKILFPRGVE